MLARMTEEDWERITHFRPSEKWGDWRKVAARLIYCLDLLRTAAGRPIIVHCAYETEGHTAGSYHYLGMAADIHIVGLHVVDQFLLASRLPDFGGIGAYPYWAAPGIHVDIGQPGRRWARDANGTYVPMNWEFIRSLM